MEIKKLKVLWFSIISIIMILGVVAVTYTPNNIDTTTKEEEIISSEAIRLGITNQEVVNGYTSSGVSQGVKIVDSTNRNDVCEKIDSMWSSMSQVEKDTTKNYFIIMQDGTQQQRINTKNCIDDNLP